MSTFGAIALNRFGLGARPGEIAEVNADPRGWLTRQIVRNPPMPSELGELASSAEMFRIVKQARMDKKEQLGAGTNKREKDVTQPDENQTRREMVIAELTEKMQAGITTNLPLYERMVSFWANHFSVSGTKGPVYFMAGAYEREAIRPHVFGRFADMVRAADLHPAMLFYLDNQQSIGPNSLAVERQAMRQQRNPDQQRKGASGLNENLAREIMELHTLGVNGGYSQTDVTNFAKVLTGWTLAKDDDDNAGTTTFMPNRHEPGAQTILGQRFTDNGEGQAVAVLDMLAHHPETAKHIAAKLVRHFVADEPPASAVSKIANVFMQTSGDLAQVMAAIINLEEPWQQPVAKFKRPDEYLISIGRALNAPAMGDKQGIGAMKRMGFDMFKAPSPQGWPDTAADWAGTDAIWKRIEYANIIASRLGQQQIDARALMEAILGETASAKTRFAVNGAESPMQALALLFCSPEFMRR